MLHQTKIVVLFLLVISEIGLAGTKPFAYLASNDLLKLKEKPCTLFHVWATWCEICVKELPDVIRYLESRKKVNPVVIDVSMKKVQDGFSKKWLKSLKPKFTTYLKTGEKDEKYLNAIDPQWKGELPYTALYHDRKLKKKWSGALNLSLLTAELDTLCGS